ncbi:MAG: hypothetical protein WAK18_05740 [Nocardioidaceae bacterium]
MIGGLAGLVLVVLLVGGLTGRVKLRSCCAVADPSNDLRMRAAFEDALPEDETPSSGRTDSSISS